PVRIAVLATDVALPFGVLEGQVPGADLVLVGDAGEVGRQERVARGAFRRDGPGAGGRRRPAVPGAVALRGLVAQRDRRAGGGGRCAGGRDEDDLPVREQRCAAGEERPQRRLLPRGQRRNDAGNRLAGDGPAREVDERLGGAQVRVLRRPQRRGDDGVGQQQL